MFLNAKCCNPFESKQRIATQNVTARLSHPARHKRVTAATGRWALRLRWRAWDGLAGGEGGTGAVMVMGRVRETTSEAARKPRADERPDPSRDFSTAEEEAGQGGEIIKSRIRFRQVRDLRATPRNAVCSNLRNVKKNKEPDSRRICSRRRTHENGFQSSKPSK